MPETTPIKIGTREPLEIKNQRDKLQTKMSLLFAALLARIKDEKSRQTVLNEVTDLEMAESEVKKKSSPGHGTGLGFAETVKLFENKKCPEDFIEFTSDIDKYIPKADYEDFEIAFERFVFGKSIEERRELAKKRGGKILEEYFINHLMKIKK